MLIPGLVSATFRSKSVDEIIELAVNSGLKAVEWSENAHVFSGDAIHSRSVYEKCAAAGLEIAAYGSYYRLGEKQDFSAVLESAQALKAPLIRVWAGAKPSANVSEEELGCLADEAFHIADLCQKKKIAVAFEWHKNTLTDSNESAVRLLELVHQSNLFCLWQPLDEQTAAERLLGIELLAKGCTFLPGSRLANMHVFFRKNAARCALKDGFEEWRKYITILDQNESPALNHYLLLEFVKDDTEKQFFEDAEQILMLSNLSKNK